MKEYIFEDCLIKIKTPLKLPKKKYLKKGQFPVVAQEESLINGYTDNEDLLFQVEDQVIVFGDHTRCLKLINFDFVVGADGAKILKIIEEINTKYFYYYLTAIMPESLGYARHYRLLKGLHFLIPPLPEQKQIVEKLDAAFADIDKAISATEKNIENAEALFHKYLDSFLHQKLKNLNETTLENVCDFVRGPFGGSLKKSIFVDDGYAVYEQKNAIYNNFDNVRYFISESKFQEMKRFEVKPDDLIMSCSGTLGKIAIAPKNLKKGIINQALLKLTPKEKIFNRYVQYYLSSNYFQNHLNEISGGAAQTNVPSVKILKQSPIKVPDLESQETLVSHLDNFKKKNIYLADLYSQKKRILLELKSSILNQAFSGELTKDAA